MPQPTQLDEETVTDLEEIRKNLKSKSAPVREEASKSLAGLTVAQLVRLCETEREDRLKRKRTLTLVIIGYIIFTALIFLISHTFQMFIYIGSFTGMIAAMLAVSPAHKQAAIALAQVEAIEGIGPLVDALEIPDPDVQTSVNASLARMLPRLRHSDSHRLNADQRRILRNLLASRPTNKSLKAGTLNTVLATLRALQQVGDESFIPVVTQLAEGHGYGEFEDVFESAKECLHFLKRAQENARAGQNLLRASSPGTSTAPEDLLRPAEAGTQTDPSDLLRATSGD